MQRTLCLQQERRQEVVKDRDRCLQHVISGCLHRKANGYRFLCGRPRAANYVEPPEESVHGRPMCEQCSAALLSQRSQDPQ